MKNNDMQKLLDLTHQLVILIGYGGALIDNYEKTLKFYQADKRKCKKFFQKMDELLLMSLELKNEK
jgi:hypothetical protein